MELKVKGNRTIATVVALIGYLVWSYINGTEPDPMIVNSLLGGALLFLRLGIKNGK